MANRAEILKQTFQNSVALPFEQVLPEVVLQKLLEEQGVQYRQTLYTPMVVLWAWVCQVLDTDKSLSNAVNRVMAWLAAAGQAVPSSDTGAYSKARKRLPLPCSKPCCREQPWRSPHRSNQSSNGGGDVSQPMMARAC